MGSNNIKKIFNDELIVFVRNVLKICAGIRKVRKEVQYESIRIQAKGCNDFIVYDGEERNFAEKLLNYVFLAVQKSKRTFELGSLSEDIPLRSVITLEQEHDGLKFEQPNDGISFLNIKTAVTQQFIAEQLGKVLNEKIDELGARIKSINPQNPFISRELIEQCWLVYVDILVFLLRNEQIINNSFGKKEILKPLLNFCDVEKLSGDSNDSVSLSLYSPISLYLFMIIYDKLEQYLKIEIRDDEEDFELIYHDIFMKQVLHAYRWFLADEEQNLYHVALSPFVEKRSLEHRLLIPVHKLDAYNSYEGIRELRLAEKIIFELDNWEVLNSEEHVGEVLFQVAIFGDLQKQPVEELGDYLTKIITNSIALNEHSKLRTTSAKLQLDVYTKTQYAGPEDYCGGRGIYSYHFHQLDDVLRNREKMDMIFGGHHLMFLLDNIDLYNKMTVEEYYNPEFYKQRLTCYDYRNCLESIQKQHNISYSGMFKELHETLTAYLYSGKWGRLKKAANNPLLQYLENKIYSSDEKKAIYVYVSDLEAFYDVYCNDAYFVRKEQYSDKEIGIIRYSTREEAVLKNNPDSQYVLSFNIWQFVKHIVIDERKHFLEKLLPEIADKTDLKQIHIGIQYDKWREMLVFDYCLEDENLVTTKVTQAVENFINKTLIPIFNEKKNYLYSEYIHKSICSFLYGNVATVEDMLFLHLYKNHKELMGKAEYTKAHNPDMVKNSINKKFKYSFKRFYHMAMQTYDISASEYIGQYKAVEMIKKSDDLEKAWRRDGVISYSTKSMKNRLFYQIVEACENLHYTKSYLYDRCNDELRKG